MVIESVLRETLATVEAQRDDAVTYLGTIRSILGALRRMPGLRACAREVAGILTRELRVESCAVLLRADGSQRSSVHGFATQAEELGAPAEPYGVETWIALADRLDVQGSPFLWLGPSLEGGFVPLGPDALSGESFQVIPFAIGDERRGAIVLHRLVAPAQSFASASAMPLIASAVGEALTIAQSRDASGELAEKLEAELGMTRSSLSARDQTLLERERTISRLADTVLQSNRAKREFLGVISHELRTPLNAIVGFASLLSEDFEVEATDDQREMMHAILDRAHHLTSLIEDVLLYVDLEAGRSRAAEAEVDLGSLIDETVATVERDGAARIELSVEIDRRVAHPRLDALLVRRVLFHLLGNAYKFTQRGRVSVLARPGDHPGAIELEVRDTGQGMPPERLQEMFELFTQGDGSSRRRHDGLGLGLALVQRAVQSLGGDVAVQSRPGEGAVVRVMIPNALGECASAAALPS